MMCKRRRQPRVISLFPRLLVPLSLSLALLLCAIGFVRYSLIALYQQAHFAPDSVHPYDGYAVGCLFLGMMALAGILLSLREPPPMRWRRARGIRRPFDRPRRAKRARSSGTIHP